MPNPAALLALALAFGIAGAAEDPHRAAAKAPAAGAEIQVPSPPFTEGIFPCTSCHDNTSQKPDRRRRPLAMHDEVVLKHGPDSRWCLDCHDLMDRDQLHLASGEKIPFTASYQLCGQCHGDKYRDWKVGIHGKRTGRWNGAKQYLLCVHCHNPHAPRFKPVKPMPPPVPPERIQARVQTRKAGAR